MTAATADLLAQALAQLHEDADFLVLVAQDEDAEEDAA